MLKVFWTLYTRRKSKGNRWNHKISKENQIIFMDKIIDYHKIIIHMHLLINHLLQAIKISKKLIKKYWISLKKWDSKNQ